MKINEKGFIKKIGVFMILLGVAGALIGIIQYSKNSSSEKEQNVIAKNSGYHQNPEIISSNNSKELLSRITSESDLKQEYLTVKLIYINSHFNEILEEYDSADIEFTVQNNSEQNIEAFKGKMKVFNIFDEFVWGFLISEDETIKPGEFKNFAYNYKIRHPKDRNNVKNLRKWNFKFEMEEIVTSKKSP